MLGSGGTRRARHEQLKSICLQNGWEVTERVNNTIREGLFALRPSLAVARQLLVTVWQTIKFIPHMLRGRKRSLQLLFVYPAPLQLVLLLPFSRMLRIPTIADVYLSMFDTFVSDRKIRSSHHPVALLLRFFDKFVMEFADTIIVDTEENADRYSEIFNIKRAKFLEIPVGATTAFYENTTTAPAQVGETNVLFYGTFIPLHGAEVFCEATQHEQLANFKFTFVGTGQTRAACEAIAAHSPNVAFIDWLEIDDLVNEIDQAHIILGIAGVSEKALSVVPNKVFQSVVRKRLVATADSPAVNRILGNCVHTFAAGDVESLAQTLNDIQHNYDTYVDQLEIHRNKLLHLISTEALADRFANRLSDKAHD